MMILCCFSLQQRWLTSQMIVFELSSRSISRKQNYRARGVYGCVHFGAQNVPIAELPSRMVICVKGSSWFGDQRGREPTKRSVSLSWAAVDIGCEVGEVHCAIWEVDKKGLWEVNLSWNHCEAKKERFVSLKNIWGRFSFETSDHKINLRHKNCINFYRNFPKQFSLFVAIDDCLFE